MIGTLLAQRYRIDAVLGEGGMGVVYQAHDTLLDRSVAIKMLSPHLLGDEGLRRLLREAQAAAKLTHPHVVAVYDVLEDAGTAAIVMEHVEGRTLRELMPVPLERLTVLTDQLLDALGYAHGRGIVHRDIKPENVLVTEDGAVKVTDFGLARSEGRSRLTQAGMVVGTVAYMAPEQALGGAIDGRTDLYAVGCVLYEVVTGHRPFDSEDPISVISQHLNVPPVVPRWHSPELPPDWEGFILKLMAKDPAERYGSVSEARRALQGLRPPTGDESEPAAGEAPAVAALLSTVRRGRLIARDAELRELKGYVDLAISGQGQMVLLAGEPGIGKTRLSREALVYARLRGARVLSGACYEQEATVAYLPFAEALRGYVRSRPPADLREEIGETGSELVKILPELTELIPGVRASPPLEPAQERLRLFDGIIDLLVRLSRAAPLVLFLDDLHWADGTSLQLLRHLARRLRAERILLLGTYRDVELDREHPLGDVLREMNRERLYQRMLLRRLDREGVRALIGAMFSVEQQVSDEFTDLIYRETEGNPFFLEEVLKHLVETGAMYREEGRWGRKTVSEIEVPQSVKEVIGRRLEQVSDPCRQTLTLAAVIGRRFDFDVLVRTADGEEDRTLDALEEAIRSQLLREEKVGSAVLYDFAHALIRETLYDGLSLRRRMRLHQRVGEALEDAYSKDPDAVVEDLAFHFGQAPHGETVDKAVTYARRAAEKALRVHANEEAVKFFAEAVDLLRETGREEEAADVLERMGEPAYLATSDPQQAVRRYQEALAYHERAGNRLRAAEVQRKLGRVLHLGFAYAEAIPHLQAALEVFERDSTPQDVTRTLLDLARAEQFSGDHEGARRNAERARVLAVEHGLRIEEAMAWAELGLSLNWSFHWEEAETAYQRAIDLSEGEDSTDARWALTRALNNLGTIAEARGDPTKARGIYERLLALGLEKRNYPMATRQRMNLGWLALHGGDWQRARRLWQEILDPDTHGDPYWVAAAERLLPWLDGDWERGIELMLAGLEQSRREGDVQRFMYLLWWLIRVAVDLEDTERAAGWSTEVVQTSDAQGAQWVVGAPTLSWAVLGLALSGRREEAARLLERMEARVSAVDVEWGHAMNALGRAVLRAQEGLSEDSGAAFTEALDRFTKMEAHAMVPWARWIFGRLLARSTDPARRGEGRILLEEAARGFEGIGASRYVAEIRKRLEAAE